MWARRHFPRVLETRFGGVKEWPKGRPALNHVYTRGELRDWKTFVRDTISQHDNMLAGSRNARYIIEEVDITEELVRIRRASSKTFAWRYRRQGAGMQRAAQQTHFDEYNAEMIDVLMASDAANDDWHDTFLEPAKGEQQRARLKRGAFNDVPLAVPVRSTTVRARQRKGFADFGFDGDLSTEKICVLPNAGGYIMRCPMAADPPVMAKTEGKARACEGVLRRESRLHHSEADGMPTVAIGLTHDIEAWLGTLLHEERARNNLSVGPESPHDADGCVGEFVLKYAAWDDGIGVPRPTAMGVFKLYDSARSLLLDGESGCVPAHSAVGKEQLMLWINEERFAILARSNGWFKVSVGGGKFVRLKLPLGYIFGDNKYLGEFLGMIGGSGTCRIFHAPRVPIHLADDVHVHNKIWSLQDHVSERLRVVATVGEDCLDYLNDPTRTAASDGVPKKVYGWQDLSRLFGSTPHPPSTKAVSKMSRQERQAVPAIAPLRKKLNSFYEACRVGSGQDYVPALCGRFHGVVAPILEASASLLHVMYPCAAAGCRAGEDVCGDVSAFAIYLLTLDDQLNPEASLFNRSDPDELYNWLGDYATAKEASGKTTSMVVLNKLVVGYGADHGRSARTHKLIRVCLKNGRVEFKLKPPEYDGLRSNILDRLGTPNLKDGVWGRNLRELMNDLAWTKTLHPVHQNLARLLAWSNRYATYKGRPSSAAVVCWTRPELGAAVTIDLISNTIIEVVAAPVFATDGVMLACYHATEFALAHGFRMYSDESSLSIYDAVLVVRWYTFLSAC